MFGRVPALAEAVLGHGVVARAGGYGVIRDRPEPIPSLRTLAQVLSRPVAMSAVVGAMTRTELQLAGLADWYDGTLTRADAAADAGLDPADPVAMAPLDRSAAGLVDLFVSDPSLGWVALRPGTAFMMGSDGRRVRDGLVHASSEVIAAMLRGLGLEPISSRRSVRLAQLEATLRSPEILDLARARLSPEAWDAFSTMLDGQPRTVEELGISWFQPPTRWTAGRGPLSPLHEIIECGLGSVSVEDQMVWVWLDVVVAARGYVFDNWSVPDPPVVSLRGDVVGLPRALSRLDLLLEAWRVAPPKALKSGGLGAQAVRASAKALRVPARDLALLGALAIELGLLHLVPRIPSPPARRAPVEEEWAPHPAADRWADDPPARRWARLVQQWRDSTQLPLETDTPERFEPADHNPYAPMARDTLVRILAELPPGRGYEPHDLATLAAWRAPAGLDGTVALLVDEMRVLGLVPPEGPVGLTTVARLLIDDGVDALVEALTGHETRFTVQSDHSVIAPPDLTPDVARRLARLAELESDAGALVYRITQAAVTRALDAGASGEEIEQFLADHSTTGLPGNVARTVRDAVAAHGRIVVGPATTVITSDDPVALAGAVAVKAARLVLLHPSVAVSDLPEAKVLAALRAKGLAPVARDPRTVADAPAGRRHHLLGTPLPLREHLMVDQPTIMRLAAHLSDTIIPRRKA